MGLLLEAKATKDNLDFILGQQPRMAAPPDEDVVNGRSDGQAREVDVDGNEAEDEENDSGDAEQNNAGQIVGQDAGRFLLWLRHFEVCF